MNRRVLACILLLAALATAAASLIVAPPAEAAACTHGATRWLYEGCCINATKYRLQWCNHGNWTNTTTIDCRPVCRF